MAGCRPRSGECWGRGGTQPGTVLLREWRGKTHRVTIEDGGVLYQGHRYRSLSQVARIITGCRWSGPAFFGLRNHGQG